MAETTREVVTYAPSPIEGEDPPAAALPEAADSSHEQEVSGEGLLMGRGFPSTSRPLREPPASGQSQAAPGGAAAPHPAAGVGSIGSDASSHTRALDEVLEAGYAALGEFNEDPLAPIMARVV